MADLRIPQPPIAPPFAAPPFANLSELYIWAGNIALKLPRHVPLTLLYLAAKDSIGICSDDMMEVTRRLVSVSMFCESLVGFGAVDFVSSLAQHGKPLQQVQPAGVGVTSSAFFAMSLDGQPFDLSSKSWQCKTPLSRCGACLKCLKLTKESRESQ